MEKLTEQLIDLAREHKLVVIEELGVSAPIYRLMDRKDADLYMALVYGHEPGKLH